MSLFVPGTDTLFESGLDNLIQHMRTNSVVAGCQVIAHAAPDMGVRVGAGSIQGNGLVVAVAQTDLVVAAAGVNPRLDLVHVDMTTGVPAIIAGAPAATPKPPALPANSIELGIVGVGVGAVNIQAGNIGDRRLIAQAGASFQSFVAIGGTPRAASGAIRLAQNGALMWRRADGVNDVGVRVTAGDVWQFTWDGFASSPFAISSGGLLTVPTTQFINFGVTPVLYNDGTVTAIRSTGGANDLIVGSGWISIGANPSNGGVVRLPNGNWVTGRNAANTGNVNVIQVAAADDWVYLGGAGVKVDSNLAVAVGLGAVAASGAIRMPNATNIVSRNAGNTADIALIGLGADNIIRLNGAAVYFAGATNSAIDMSGNITMTGVGIFGTNPASVGGIRIPNNVQIVSRNAANTNNQALIYLDTTDRTVVAPGGGLTQLSGVVEVNVTGGTVSTTGDIRMRNTGTLQWRNGGNTGDVGSISVLATNELQLGDAVNPVRLNAGAGTVDFRYAVTALGGGAAPTLGTIGGTGPAAAAQHSWLKILINGTASFLPVWR